MDSLTSTPYLDAWVIALSIGDPNHWARRYQPHSRHLAASTIHKALTTHTPPFPTAPTYPTHPSPREDPAACNTPAGFSHRDPRYSGKTNDVLHKYVLSLDHHPSHPLPSTPIHSKTRSDLSALSTLSTQTLLHLKAYWSSPYQEAEFMAGWLGLHHQINCIRDRLSQKKREPPLFIKE